MASNYEYVLGEVGDHYESGNGSDYANGSDEYDYYYDEDYIPLDDYWQFWGRVWLFKTIGPLLIVVGTLGNITALLVLLRKTFRKQSTGFILCALAVVDTGMLYTGLLRHCVMAISDFDMRTVSVTSCRLHYYLTYLFSQASPMTVSLMAVDRMISVWFPLYVKRMPTVRVIMVTWVVAMVILMAYNAHAFATIDLHFDDYSHTSHCYFSKDPHHDWLHKAVFYWTNATLSSFLPIVILFTCNALIIAKLVHRDRNVNTTAVSSRSITIMLLTVSSVFLLCTLPITIYFIGTGKGMWWPEETSEDRAKLDLAYGIFNILYYTNNAINFFLYCLAGTKFRKELKTMLKSAMKLGGLSSVSESSVTQPQSDDTAVTAV